jgi:hypothetical protein
VAAAGFDLARQRCHTPRVLPQILESYEEATNFFSQVKAAQSERTALNWRAAIDEARRRLDAERPAEPVPTADDPAALPSGVADLLPKLDVA